MGSWRCRSARQIRAFSDMLDAAGEPQPQFKPQTGDPRARALIQRGILDFAALYVKRVPQGAQRAISGADAYAPVSLLKRARNRPVMERARG